MPALVIVGSCDASLRRCKQFKICFTLLPPPLHSPGALSFFYGQCWPSSLIALERRVLITLDFMALVLKGTTVSRQQISVITRGKCHGEGGKAPKMSPTSKAPLMSPAPSQRTCPHCAEQPFCLQALGGWACRYPPAIELLPPCAHPPSCPPHRCTPRPTCSGLAARRAASGPVQRAASHRLAAPPGGWQCPRPAAEQGQEYHLKLEGPMKGLASEYCKALCASTCDAAERESSCLYILL